VIAEGGEVVRVAERPPSTLIDPSAQQKVSELEVSNIR